MTDKFHVHFMGIAGSGASAVAAIAQAQGYEVTGCDQNIHNEFTQPFRHQQLFTGHDPKHLQTAKLLAISPAILSLDPNNPELNQAVRFGIPIISWQQFMGQYLEQDQTVIAICGTHGKSTTTAMAGLLLEKNAFDPTVELGAIVPDWGKNYRIGQSKYFVTEADEFNNNFLVSHPDITIVTSLEMDHPEFFHSFDDYIDSFISFLSQTKRLIIANLSDPNVAEAVKFAMKQTNVSVIDYTKSEYNLSLLVPGKHNLMNAQAVFCLGLSLRITPDRIKQSLEEYQGLGRRLEKIGEINKALIYSDFGHHPTEIKVTIEAVRQAFNGKKIVLIYQPHMFSRTIALFSDFVTVFKQSPLTKLFLMEIFPSREIDLGLVRSTDLVKAVNELPRSKLTGYQCSSCPSCDHAVNCSVSCKNEASTDENTELVTDTTQFPSLLKPYLNDQHVIIFMGAGSIDTIARQFVKNYEN